MPPDTAPGAPPSLPGKAIKVMVVDDSAVIRGMITRVLESDPDITVISSLPNGQMAVQQVATVNPDVILLDIEMPVMDGIEALQKIMAQRPHSKIIMCSTLTQKNAALTLKAFDLGAVECLAKPTNPHDISTEGMFRSMLVGTVKALGKKAGIGKSAATATASATATPTAPRSSLSVDHINLRPAHEGFAGKPALVAIGSSTGGPQALFEVLKSLKQCDVPIVITQHMPPTFTAILAQHITLQSGFPAAEGQEGMILEKGKVYVAPGGKHMEIHKNAGGQMVAALNNGPPENFCKPAVDVMVRSIVSNIGNRVIAVMLTGMGQDGLIGCEMLAKAGGRVIAQDETTSVVWGMPGAVAKAGICQAVLPLSEIGGYLHNMVRAGGAP